MQTKKGKIFVLSGPSGVGKGSIIRELISLNKNLILSISATTRKPRKNETHGKDYYFLEEEAFLQKIKKEEFIEFCLVHNNYYGTLKTELDKQEIGKNIIIEIDTQGAEKIKKLIQATLIFIGTPITKYLKDRLTKRDTENTKAIKTRIQNSKKELKKINIYDYVLLNTSLFKSVEKLNKLIYTKEIK